MQQPARPPVRFSRQELFDRVWSVPAVQLAKEVGVTGEAIGKACRRHQIPRPSRGYWARVAAGQKPERPRLPALADPDLQTATFTPQLPRVIRRGVGGTVSPAEIGAAFLSPEVAELYARVSQQPPSWEVPRTLRAPHPSVAATLEELRLRAKEPRRLEPGEADLVLPNLSQRDRHTLDVGVSRPLIERACRLIQGIISAAVSVGFELRECSWTSTCFTLLDRNLYLSVREHTWREERERTAKELEEDRRRGYPRRKWEYSLSGLIRVSLTVGGRGYETARWRDGKVRRVEQMISPIVHRMLVEVDRELTREREMHERKRREQDEAVARRLEGERLQREQARINGLLAEVQGRDTALRIRRYLREVRRRAAEQGTTTKGGIPIDQWLAWAEKVADDYDPFGSRKSLER